MCLIWARYFTEGGKLLKCAQSCNEAAGENEVEKELVGIEDIGSLGRPLLG